MVDAVLLPPPPQSLPTTRTVGQLIRERFELSIYQQALAGTALLAALDAATPNSPVTCFAPSNAAFIRYAASSPGFFISDATGRAVNPGTPGLRDVLKYGLVAGRFTSSTLSALTSPLTSVMGNVLYLDYIHGVYKNYLYVNGCRARIMDLMASDGVVHVLECVPQVRCVPPLSMLRWAGPVLLFAPLTTLCMRAAEFSVAAEGLGVSAISSNFHERAAATPSSMHAFSTPTCCHRPWRPGPRAAIGSRGFDAREAPPR